MPIYHGFYQIHKSFISYETLSVPFAQFKIRQNNHGGVLLSVKLQTEAIVQTASNRKKHHI